MDRKVLIPVFVLVIFSLGLILVSFIDTTSSSLSANSSEELRFNVSSQSLSLSELIEDIKTQKYYEGYNTSILKWMGSLGEKKVFSSSTGFIIMDTYDASKIPSFYALDADFYEIFDGEVVENHSLGNTKYPKTVYYVKNVEYIGEEAIYYLV